MGSTAGRRADWANIRIAARQCLIAGVALAVSTSSLALPRSPSVKAEFRKTHPCPSTGRKTGACPGWQVDHRQALVCGGADTVDNLQWLTVEAHREKTRWDLRACTRR